MKSNPEIRQARKADASDIAELIYSTSVVCCFTPEQPCYQKLGIGKQLWNFALRRGALGNVLTVRSSLFTVPVYESLGFVATEPPKTFNGMHYQTMVARYG